MALLAAPQILRLPPPSVSHVDAEQERLNARSWQRIVSGDGAADRRATALQSPSAIHGQLDDALPIAVDQWRPWRSLAFFAQSYAQRQPPAAATLDLRLYGHPGFALYQAADRGFGRPGPAAIDLAV